MSNFLSEMIKIIRKSPVVFLISLFFTVISFLFFLYHLGREVSPKDTVATLVNKEIDRVNTEVKSAEDKKREALALIPLKITDHEGEKRDKEEAVTLLNPIELSSLNTENADKKIIEIYNNVGDTELKLQCLQVLLTSKFPTSVIFVANEYSSLSQKSKERLEILGGIHEMIQLQSNEDGINMKLLPHDFELKIKKYQLDITKKKAARK